MPWGSWGGGVPCQVQLGEGYPGWGGTLARGEVTLARGGTLAGGGYPGREGGTLAGGVPWLAGGTLPGPAGGGYPVRTT